MAQEFFIKSDNLESKVREILPSQGGLGAGFDLSASTQIVPIVDLTETAEGSNVRADLQTSLSFDTVTTFSVTNTSSTLISNTGYYRIFGNCSINTADASKEAYIALRDGVGIKKVWNLKTLTGVSAREFLISPFDFNVFLKAGNSVTAETDDDEISLIGGTRQIADINGTLVDP